jgi:hypothetical protein
MPKRLRRAAEIERRKRELERKRATLEARLQAEREEFAAQEEEALKEIAELRLNDTTLTEGWRDAAQLRGANGGAKIKQGRPLRARGGNGEDRQQP